MIEFSDAARRKLEEAFIFAAKELLKSGVLVVTIDARAVLDINGTGGIRLAASSVMLPGSQLEKKKGEGIPGDAKQIAGEELIRILKSKKEGD